MAKHSALPLFQEQYNQNNPVAIGNPNLQPEEIETWELAFNYFAMDTLHLALNLFHYEVTDKIVIVPLGQTEAGFGNAGGWKGNGFEFETRWKTSNKSSLLFNYSYQDSENDEGFTLSNAPKQAAFLRADYLIGSKWYLDAQVNWNDGWAREANDPRDDLEGYTTMDLILRHKDTAANKMNFAIGIKNLFDSDVRYPSPAPNLGSNIVNIPNDIPGAGRSYFMEMRYKF